MAERPAFLALLLTAPGHAMPESAVAEALYGAHDETTSSRLRSLARELRGDLGLTDRHRLHKSDSRWVLDLDVRRDVDECDAHLAAAEQAAGAGRFGAAARAARDALALFRGDPLAGLENFDGLVDIVERLEHRRDRALAVLSVATDGGTDGQSVQDLLHDAAQRGRSDKVRAAEARLGPRALEHRLQVARPTVVGRDALIDDILQAVAAADRQRVDRIVVRISGPGGIGKTTVVQALTEKLGDMSRPVISLDLRGTAQRPRRAAQAQAEALRISGRPPVPSNQLEGAYRELFPTGADNVRTLLVLDNVEDHEQVGPLLPPQRARAVVVVASRRDLGGLGSSDATVAFDVKALDPAPALQLLANANAGGISDRESHDAERLVTMCAGVPFYLAVTGSKVAIGEATYRDCVKAIERLELRFLNDSERDVSSLLTFGIREASEPVLRALVAVTDLDCPVVDVDLVAAALGQSTRAAEAALSELAARRLLEPQSPSYTGRPRWAVHSIVRSFGRGRRTELCPGYDRYRSLARLADAVTDTATGLAYRSDPSQITPVLGGRGVEPIGLGVEMAWFDERRESLVALVGQLWREREWDRCWRLAAAIDPLLDLRMDGPDREHVLDWATEATGQSHGIEAVRRRGWVLFWRSGLLRYEGYFSRALATAVEARQLLLEGGDAVGAAAALLRIGDIRIGDLRPGEPTETRHAEALGLIRDANAELTALGHDGGRANAAQELGQVLAMSGHRGEALHHLSRAHDLYADVGAIRGMAQVLRLQAATRRVDGDLLAAESDCRAAIAAAEACDDLAESARAHVTLGVILRDRNTQGEALLAFEQAQDYFEGVYDRRWLGVSTYHVAEILKIVQPNGGAWRVQAERALDIATSVRDEAYRDLAERLLEQRGLR